MAFSFDDLHKTKPVHPPRVLIYGPPNAGKTTFAASWPNPIFIQTEAGEGSLELTTFKSSEEGPMATFDEVIEALTLLGSGSHEFKTVVIDSIDKLEPLVWAHACRENNWVTIEDPGFGKGYIEIDRHWDHIFSITEYLRLTLKMNILLLAHDEIAAAPDPSNVEYKRFTPRLHKRAHARVIDDMDIIGFMHRSVTVSEKDAGGGFGKKVTKAEGGQQVWLELAAPAFAVTKCRYEAPAKIIIPKASGYAAIAPFLPAQPVAAAAE
jgi:hypothetical protein